MAIELTNESISINDSIPVLIGNKALFELINDKSRILELNSPGKTIFSVYQFNFWLSYKKFHNIVFKENDRNIQKVYIKGVIDDLNELRSKTSSSDLLFIQAIDLLLTTFLNEDLAFVEARLNENMKN